MKFKFFFIFVIIELPKRSDLELYFTQKLVESCNKLDMCDIEGDFGLHKIVSDGIVSFQCLYFIFCGH